METRANYILIGLFTLAVTASAFGFVYWFSRGGDGGTRDSYRVVFSGSVSGLRVGASVLFNGIRVGEVTRLDFDRDRPTQSLALIAVERGVPVRQDTQVTLEFQGLTGLAAVALAGGSPDRPAVAPAPGQPPTLLADPGLSRDITHSARDLMAHADAVLGRIDTVITDNQDALRNAVRNIDAFSATLAKYSERFDRILAGVEHLTGGPDGKGELPEAARSMRQLAENLDKRTAELWGDLSKFTGSGLKQWELLAVDGRRTLAELNRAIRNFDRNPQRVLFGPSSAEAQPPRQR